VLAQISQGPNPGQVLISFQTNQDQFLKLKVLLAPHAAWSGLPKQWASPL
jgi:hypothetical protein